MKATIAHLPEEEAQAKAWVASIKAAEPGVKVRKSDAHPPFKHIYLTTGKPAKRCKSNEIT